MCCTAASRRKFDHGRESDTAPYNDIPITVQTAPEMALLRVEGADCSSCPAGGNQWIVLADVAAGGTQTITMEASTAGLSVDGVVALPISAALVNSGLPSDPQAPARSQYTLDRGMASVSVLNKHDIYLCSQVISRSASCLAWIMPLYAVVPLKSR